MKPKQVVRTAEGAVLAGVIAGIAKYFDHDPVLFRVIAIALIILTGIFPGALVYFIAWLIIPKEVVPPPTSAATYTVLE